MADYTNGRSLEERFFNRVNKQSNGCWIWTGKIEKDGYGRAKHLGRSYRAHRLSWLIKFGDIEDGIQVLHRCDTPLCVNPDHLFLGTQLDNMIDRNRKGRANTSKGIKHYAAKLSDADVLYIREAVKTGSWGIKTRLAQELGVGRSCITKIIQGHTRSSI